MELTEKKRLKIYKRLLRNYENKLNFWDIFRKKISTTYGLCNALYDFRTIFSTSYRLKFFPELLVYKSLIKRYSSISAYWYPQGNKESRILLLKMCINHIENNVMKKIQ